MKRSHTRRKKEKMDNSVLWILAGLFLFFIYPSQTADAPSSTNSYLTDADRIKMKNILDVGYKFNDLSTAHYLVVGYKSMGERIKREAEICGFLISSAKEPSLSAESIYYIASTWKALGVCQPKSLNLNTLTKALNSYLDKESSNFQTLYYTIHSLVSFGEKIPEATVTKVVNTLQNALKKDYTISNAGYAFHIAADLGAAASFAFNHVEDAIAEADEIDSKFLQYEGGLSVTSLIVNGVYKLSASLKKKPPINLLQTVKFANYFLSRRSVQTSKGAANLLSSVNMLATSEYEKPICISLTDDGVIISNKQPHIKVKICDILGKPITSISNVVANTATKVGDDVVVISKKNFQSTPNDKSVFTLNFLAANPDPGFYKIAVSAGSIQNTLTVKVLTEIVVDSFEIGAADADQITQPKLTKLEYPKKLSKTVEADFQQKIILKFSLKETNKNKPMRVHQAFVRLTPASSKDKQELIFTAEADSSNVYKFEMPVSNSAKMFNYQNGDYNIELIIGDAVLSNSFQWVLGTVSLKFPEGAVSEDVKKPPYKQPNVYTLQTEIKHMFREPEKRPPVFVSNLFTGLCLAPLLLLLILWIKLDINISNFPLSLSAIIFHLGLGCIFVLFGIFWLQLNMFTTLRYLTVLGIITFLSGHKLLSQIAKNRKLHSC